MASDIICEESTAKGFCNVLKARLKPNVGIAYLVNATDHSRFGVSYFKELLAVPPFETTIVPVTSRLLLDTVWDANDVRYEHYTIRIMESHV
jgi:hypothetical protein